MREKAKRIMGIDYGLKRIGIAISDVTWKIASSCQCLQASRRSEQSISALCLLLQKMEEEKECSIVKIVLGFPLMMNGKVGLQADEVRLFADQLRQRLALPVELWDERLTTVQAERSLREVGLSRKKRVGKVDGIAAALILQSYLDTEQCRQEKELWHSPK